MKCVRCGHDSKKKDRAGGTCPQCRGRFAFEPQDGDPFTDKAFAHAIEVVSAEGTVRFLPAHVYYQLCRQKRGASTLARILVAIAVVAAGTGAAVAFDRVAFGCIGALAGGVVAMGLTRLLGGFARDKFTIFRRSNFDALWERWVKVHGGPKGLITPRRKPIERSAALDEELRQYSFDRAVVCDRPEIVDTLVANHFHFENNCAILTAGGYPPHAFDTVRAMLRNNPRLLVLVVHDATPEGCGLAFRLKSAPDWFAPGARVVDIGLRPAHARFFEGQIVAHPKPRPVAVGPGIDEGEARWLARHRLEATAIRPEQLVKRLFKAITVAEAGGLDGGGGASGTDSVSILGMDTSTTDGGGDSFG